MANGDQMANRNKLVIITSINISDKNAPAIHILSLTKQLLLLGYEIVLVAPEYQGTLQILLPREQLTIEPTKRLSLPAIPNSLSAIAQLPALWRNRHAGPLYIRTGPMSFILSTAARLIGYRRIIMEVNGWFADELTAMGYPRVITWLFEKLQIFELRLASSIRVVTKGLKVLLVESGIKANKIHFIDNGTNLDLFRPRDRSACRKKLNLRDRITYLVFAGNLAEWLDLMTILKAIRIVLAEGYDIEFLILGHGRARDKFENEASQIGLAGKVHFLGAQSPEVVNEYFNAADIGVASFFEARNKRIGLSPLKIRDFAAAGLPFVTSDLPGLDTLKGQSWVELAEPENPDDFARAIMVQIKAAGDKNRQAARAYAEQNFSWKDVVQHLERLLR